MKHFYTLLRVLFGLPLFGFGLFGLVTVMPDPHAAWESQEGFSEEATRFLLELWDSGFVMHTVVITHVAAGLLVLLNRFVALALILHLPVSFQMVLFHLNLDPATGGFAYLILILNLSLMFSQRRAYRDLCRARPDER